MRRLTNSALSDLKKLSTVARQAICKANLPRGGGIVVTDAFPTHGHLEPVLAQQLLIVVSAVLRSRCPATVCLQTARGAIRVMNAAWWWPSDRPSRGSHVQRPHGEILLHAVADGPSDDAPGEKVNDHGKINPTLPRPDLGDVARLLPGNGLPANHERALLVRPARLEVLLQEIRRDVEDVVAVGASSGKRSPGSFSDPPPP